MAGNARLRYESSGRGGTIYFENEDTTFDMWWEFAGGNALAIIGIPSSKHWVAQTKLPLEKREIVLQFIGEQVIEDQAAGMGYFEIDDGYLTIFK
ncbi:MAG: hypothetical protein HY842_18705 [Bacteroidetes bacterium]|nr:hypothetical protein [Bacteroidota bacterium]